MMLTDVNSLCPNGLLSLLTFQLRDFSTPVRLNQANRMVQRAGVSIANPLDSIPTAFACGWVLPKSSTRTV